MPGRIGYACTCFPFCTLWGKRSATPHKNCLAFLLQTAKDWKKEGCFAKTCSIPDG
nr:hypothetical protein DWUX_333 [Desulfovibrio diazotrophicus]